MVMSLRNSILYIDISLLAALDEFAELEKIDSNYEKNQPRFWKTNGPPNVNWS